MSFAQIFEFCIPRSNGKDVRVAGSGTIYNAVEETLQAYAAWN
jgi:hypothetical protein